MSDRAKRIAFSSLLACGVLAAAEILSLGFLVLSGGGGSPLGRLHAERRAARDAGPLPGLGAGEARVNATIASEALHPYLGFVFDPALNAQERRRRGRDLRIDEHGFFRPPGPARERSGDEFRVGVFGGSVALLFSFQGADRLAADLAASPALDGRPVVVDSFALGGFKQPQQLAALTYFLALGERFDAVINLDGFNEVALPVRENLRRGVFPFYPRAWSLRVGERVQPRLVQMAGEAAVLRRRRAALARSSSRPILEWSPTWNLLWLLRDRSLRTRLAAVEGELATFRPADESYAALGPPFEARGDELYRRLAEVWAESSLQMHHLCRGNGILYLHLLQPNQYVPGSKPMGARERARAFREDHHHRPAVVAGYPELAAAGTDLRRRGVDFLDLTGIFRDHPEPLYIDPCCHFSRAGSELVAARAAAELRRLLEGGR